MTLCFVSPSSVTAKSIKEYFSVLSKNADDYFQVSYEPIGFNPTEIHGREVFYMKIKGKAICIKNLPIAPREAVITFSVLAKHKLTKQQQILNSAYTVYEKSIPKKKGEVYEINKQIPLRFPNTSKSGEYMVAGKAIEAKIKLPLVGWQNIIRYIPRSKDLGTVKYFAK